MGVFTWKIWEKGEILGWCDMIFVVTGLMYGFERLVQKMDEIAEKKDEEIIMQIGEIKYEPKKSKYFKFASKDEMDKLYENSRIVICHAGVGSILSAIEHNKPFIAVPRSKVFKETIDDHQFQIAKDLEKRGIPVVYDIDLLESAINDLKSDSKMTFTKENTLITKLKDYLSLVEEM